MNNRIYLAILAFGAMQLAACDERAVAPRRLNPTADEDVRAGSDLNLSANVMSVSRIGLQWNDNSRNESGWEVHRSINGVSGTFTLLGTTAADVTSYLDTALAPLTGYCYEVRSFRLTGNRKSYDAFSNASCATTPSLPAPPTGVRVVAGPSYTDVSWTNSVSQTDSTRLERAAQVAGPWQHVATFTPSNLPNATSYREYGLPLEQPICYRLIAFNQWGASAPSNTPCSAIVAPPSGLVAVSPDGHSVTLTWKDNSAFEDGYVVGRSPDASSWTVIANVPPNATSYNDASIALDTRYAYHVQAKKDGTVTVAAGPVWIAVPSGPPLAPTEVSASPSGSTVVGIRWSSPSVTSTSYRLERSIDGQATWQLAGSSTDLWFFDGQRVPDREVCYRVYAANSFGESPASPVGCTKPPLAPTNVSVVPQNDSQLVSWTDNSSVEDSYVVYVSYDLCDEGGCIVQCYSDGCYPVWCDADGCYRPPRQWRSYDLAANTTRTLIGGLESFEAVYAVRDGGYSDPGTITAVLAAGATRLLPNFSRRATVGDHYREPPNGKPHSPPQHRRPNHRP